MTIQRTEQGSAFAPHTPGETEEMLDAIGVESEAALFDIPDAVAFDGECGIEGRSEREIRAECERLLGANDDLVEFLGRGHYGHYVPSLVDNLSLRSEFLTSYTQYQPEIAQGFLQALFEYQSMFVELTGLEIVNCSMYDAAAALGEAATLAARVRETSGSRVLVPGAMVEGRRSVLENYCVGSGMTIESYPLNDANVDLEALDELVDDDCVMVYVENPTVSGTIEENVAAVSDLAHDHDALLTVGSDPVAMALLEAPADAGADVVIGDAATLGLPVSYGMGLGLFATRERFVRQVPGRLVGASEDAAGRRVYTLTLQTREQHIRRERATSNICTNQAWVGLRVAMHLACLGSSGLVELATSCVTRANDLAARLDEIDGIQAPVHDRHHFREFVTHTDQPAAVVASDLEAAGYAVHVVGEHRIQVCATELNEDAIDGFVGAVEEAAK